jgi:DNA-binding HxlR family transcriptional regulator
MTGLRTYGDPCGIARALDAIGERWSLLIVRELLYGPKRFTDLRNGLAGASANVLSQRLRELQEVGVVRRQVDGGPKYALTDWGRDLRPILVQLGRWGARSAERPAGDLGVDALMVALEATFLHDDAADLEANIELHLDEATYSVGIDHGSMESRRESARRPDAVITTDPATLRSVVFGDRTLKDAAVRLDGDRTVARAFLRLFRRPQVRR